MEILLKSNEGVLEVQSELLKIVPTLSEKPYICEIRPYKKKRSLDANAYFHVLVDKIAKVLRQSAEEVKVQMVFDYGTIATDEKGLKVGFEARRDVPISRFYKYAKQIGQVFRNDNVFYQYIIYKETHTLDSAEMARLIDGTIEEAKQLGIETLTPAELEILKGYEKTIKSGNCQKMKKIT